MPAIRSDEERAGAKDRRRPWRLPRIRGKVCGWYMIVHDSSMIVHDSRKVTRHSPAHGFLAASSQLPRYSRRRPLVLLVLLVVDKANSDTRRKGRTCTILDGSDYWK